MDAIRLEHIYFKKENSTFDLEDINIIIKENKTYGFLGADNTGKTTLASIIGGFIKADKGDIYHFDTNINTLALDIYRSQRIGHLFKYGVLFNDYTVKANLEIVSNLKKRYANIHKIIDTLKEINFDLKLLNVKAKDLSLLERQKVSLARALIKDIRLIVAIDPTYNLNDDETDEFLEILLKICKTRNIALIITTNSNYVCKDLDHIYGFNKGRVNFIK